MILITYHSRSIYQSAPIDSFFVMILQENSKQNKYQVEISSELEDLVGTLSLISAPEVVGTG